MNCDDLQLQTASLVNLKCYCLWPKWTIMTTGHKQPLCDVSNIFEFGHNELWWLLTTNSLSVTSQILLPLDKMNCDYYRPQTASLWHLKFYCLYLQWTVMTTNHKQPLSDIPNVIAFGHKELWLLPTTNSLSVPTQRLLPFATMNCDDYRPQTAAMWLFKWYCLLS